MFLVVEHTYLIVTLNYVTMNEFYIRKYRTDIRNPELLTSSFIVKSFESTQI